MRIILFTLNLFIVSTSVFAENLVQNYLTGEGESTSMAIEISGAQASLYLSDKLTNQPLLKAKVFLQAEKNQIEFTESSEPGIYSAKLTTSEIYNQVIVQSGDDVDTIDISVPEYKKQVISIPPSASISLRSGIIIVLITSLFWLLLGCLIFYFRKRRSISASLGILILVSFPTHCVQNVYAHGGHEHPGDAKQSAEETSTGSDIIMSKKSQFLIGLKTVPAKLEDANTVMKSFGHVISPPQNDAVIVAPQAGYLKTAQDLKLGKKVKRGEILGYIQTVNQIALSSPIEGFVSEIFAFNGVRVEGGGKVIRIINPSTLWVDAELFANQIERLPQIQSAYVTAGSGNSTVEAKLQGSMTPISEETRTAKVFLELVTGHETLKVGTFVDITFELNAGNSTAKKQQGFIIQKSAVLSRAGEPVIFVQTGAETFIVRPVSYEDSARPGQVLIKSGIKEGDRVVVTGGYQLLMKAK